MSGDRPDAIYRGTGGRDVAVLTPDGDLVGPLHHVVRHSPTGFAWGYAGSGPADLARSIVVDALGERAACPACLGRLEVVWDVDAEQAPHPSEPPRPIQDGDRDPDNDALLIVDECSACDGCGIRGDLPYQDFKAQFIAVCPDDQAFEIRRSEVLAWLAERGVTS